MRASPARLVRRIVGWPRRVVSRVEQRLYTHVGRRGPYRFLLDSWGRVSDLELAAKVVDVEFFRSALKPVPLPLSDFESMLVFAPHQDDETIGAGGTMILAGRSGVRVTVAYVTDGMQTNLPCSAEESVAIRFAEAEKACSIAGAEMVRIDIPNIRPTPTTEHLDRIAATVKETNPDVILVPWLLDGPAKHRMVNHLLLLAYHRSELPDCEVWGYQVHSGIIPNGYVDITSVMAEKLQMLQAFESQNSHSQCYDHLSEGLSAWNSRYLPTKLGSISKRYAEVFFTIPLREHVALTERFYLKDLEQTYRGNQAVMSGMRQLQSSVEW